MNLRDLIEKLQALQPSSALEASVTVAAADEDIDVVDVCYDAGRVTIETDADGHDSYEEGYDDGFAAGKKQTEADAEDGED